VTTTARRLGFTVAERQARISEGLAEIAAIEARLPRLRGKARQQAADRRAYLVNRNGRDLRAIGNGGREAPPKAAKMPDWTARDEQRLVELVEAHRPYTEIAARLHRSVCTVIARAGALDARLSRASGRSILQTASLLGLDWHAVNWWIARGWLKAEDAGLDNGAQIVEYEELLRFLADETHWHLWEPARIADEAMREWAIEERRGLEFLTTAQAGERLFLTHFRVNQLIRAGKIRAVKRGANWFIRSDWLPAEWMPDRGGYKRRAFTDDERAFVCCWWGQRPATWIAAQLGRPDSSVGKLARECGLAGVGRGAWKRQSATLAQ